MPIAYTPPFAERKRPDREVVEAMTHEEFAERAGRRLEEVADRLEAEGKELGLEPARLPRSRRVPRSLGWQRCWYARRPSP